LQNLLKKVITDVSGITVSDEADIITRMEVFSGVITEMDKMFTMLSVSTSSVLFDNKVLPVCYQRNLFIHLNVAILLSFLSSVETVASALVLNSMV